MSKILYGKPCADEIYSQIQGKSDRIGKLFAVGFDDDKWNQYVNSLKKSASRCNVQVEQGILPINIDPHGFNDYVAELSNRKDVSGIILQQPLPTAYRKAVNYIDPHKDVDCLNPQSVARMYYGIEGIRPATPRAVIRLLDFYGIDLQGKNTVIIGRGNSVGKPLALLALQRNATVTVCHTKTADLAAVCRNADILVSACGAPNIVTPDFVKDSSIVIDVGLSFENGVTCGDVSKQTYDVCRAVTPVPGGVGPVTRAVLFENLILASELNNDD